MLYHGWPRRADICRLCMEYSTNGDSQGLTGCLLRLEELLSGDIEGYDDVQN